MREPRLLRPTVYLLFETTMTEHNQTPDIQIDENAIMAERRHKLSQLRAQGVAFPNDFVPEHRAAQLHEQYGAWTREDLEQANVQVSIAGRMMLKRVMGKASFATVQDGTGQIQFYINDKGVTEAVHEQFKHWDMGDIVATTGQLFKTQHGELSVRCANLRLLSKSLRPLPDKFHGLADQEMRYRQRYVDLIVTPETRATFIKRTKAMNAVREFMVENNFMEVETPMLHPIPGGASAKTRKRSSRVPWPISPRTSPRSPHPARRRLRDPPATTPAGQRTASRWEKP